MEDISLSKNQSKVQPLPEKWTSHAIKDLAYLNKANLNNQMNCSVIHYIDIDSVEEGVIKNIRAIAVKSAPSRAKRIVNDKDILVSSVRPNLKHFCKIRYPKPCTVASTGFVVLTPKEINPDFLYYSITTKEFTNYLSAIAETSTTAYPSITADVVANYSIACPPENEQKAIAKILSDLDSKLELNQKMNETLESIAQAIFKHWFIDFEFPNEEGKPYKSSGGEMVDSELGKVPKKWAIKTLDGIANFLNGLALQRYPAITENDYLPVIKIKEMNYGISGSSDKASRDIPSEYIVHNGDVLFAWSGSLGVTIWCNGEGALNQHIFKISSNEYPKWFYYEWLLYYLPNFIEIARDKATTMGHIQRHHISESLVAVPDSNTLEIMNNVLKLIIDRIINLKVENDTLTKTRDLFLPSLISGKIRVPLEG